MPIHTYMRIHTHTPMHAQTQTHMCAITQYIWILTGILNYARKYTDRLLKLRTLWDNFTSELNLQSRVARPLLRDPCALFSPSLLALPLIHSGMPFQIWASVKSAAPGSACCCCREDLQRQSSAHSSYVCFLSFISQLDFCGSTCWQDCCVSQHLTTVEVVTYWLLIGVC